jgi:hypothetical protein
MRQIDEIKKYLELSNRTSYVYFCFIGDEQYVKVLRDLTAMPLKTVRVSDFCASSDNLPDLDGLVDCIKDREVGGILLRGLGEYLALIGNNVAREVLVQLKDLNVGATKVVIILRGVATLTDYLKKDLRFDGRRYTVIDKAECNLSFTLCNPSANLGGLSLKECLHKLEDGYSGEMPISTAINLDNSMFTVHKINSAHEIIRFSVKGFDLERSLGTDEQWGKLYEELQKSNNSLDEVFEKRGFGSNFESEFYKRIAESGDYGRWLYFIYLKSKVDAQQGYLRFVLDNTDSFESLADNTLSAIIDISHTDRRFVSFYRERKVLIKNFPDTKISGFVTNNRIKPSESIYKLTDNTEVERQEIIRWLAQNNMPEKEMFALLENIYPLLGAYLKPYAFKSEKLNDLLRDYFEAYKRQKLHNRLDAEFLERVDKLAKPPRKFNQLPTRNEIVNKIEQNSTYLYWLDALGVEYLGLIEELAQKHGLSVKTNIVRTELPSVTFLNKDFYENWHGDKEKDSRLDDAIHNKAHKYKSGAPAIHLSEQLNIIDSMIGKGAEVLDGQKVERFLIASDHGASRLAVLHDKEEKYETDSKGERSGRCCEVFPSYKNDLPFATVENGYIVLADYGRFKGGRAAEVEVHGGASLEEVVIPVVELTLKESSVTVKLVDENVVVDFSTGTEITLFFDSRVQDISVVLNDKRYIASQVDENHYLVKLQDINRAGEYFISVYAGNDLVGDLAIKARGKTAKVNADFASLFKEV